MNRQEHHHKEVTEKRVHSALEKQLLMHQQSPLDEELLVYSCITGHCNQELVGGGCTHIFPGPVEKYMDPQTYINKTGMILPWCLRCWRPRWCPAGSPAAGPTGRWPRKHLQRSSWSNSAACGANLQHEEPGWAWHLLQSHCADCRRLKDRNDLTD